jgi:hypothetical protein
MDWVSDEGMANGLDCGWVEKLEQVWEQRMEKVLGLLLELRLGDL